VSSRHDLKDKGDHTSYKAHFKSRRIRKGGSHIKIEQVQIDLRREIMKVES